MFSFFGWPNNKPATNETKKMREDLYIAIDVLTYTIQEGTPGEVEKMRKTFNDMFDRFAVDLPKLIAKRDAMRKAREAKGLAV